MYPYVFSSYTWSVDTLSSLININVFKVEIKEVVYLNFFFSNSFWYASFFWKASSHSGETAFVKGNFQPSLVILYITEVAKLFNKSEKKKKYANLFPLLGFHGTMLM